MLSVVKATAAKLKFTLNGSVARDREYQQMALSSAKERLVNMEAALVDVESVFRRVGNDPIDINVSGNLVNINLRWSRDGTVFVPSFLRVFVCYARFIQFALATCYAVHINAFSI